MTPQEEIDKLKKQLEEKEELIKKLTAQVVKHNKNGKPVTPIKGVYKSVGGDTFRFRDNASSFIGIGGKKLDTENLLKAAAGSGAGKTEAVAELERIIKMGSNLLVKQEKAAQKKAAQKKAAQD